MNRRVFNGNGKEKEAYIQYLNDIVEIPRT